MGDYAGITWHFVNEGVDSGKIIKSYHVEVKEEDISLSLLQRENETIKRTLQELLPQFIKEEFPIEKPRIYQEYIHKSSDVPNQGILDLSWEGERISRFLRCMDFGPLLTLGRPYFKFKGNKYVIRRYKIDKDSGMKNTVSMPADNMFQIRKDGYIFSLYIADDNIKNEGIDR